VAILFLDVDQFKGLNDRLGHNAGDAALISIAQVLQSFAGANVVVGRFGGDEFVLAIDRTSELDARRLCARIHEHLDRAIPSIQLSLGLAMRENGEALDDVLRRADLAMFAAKSAYAGTGTASGPFSSAGRYSCSLR
jgi:diguanylate cyclase (GGDEF)-like protein